MTENKEPTEVRIPPYFSRFLSQIGALGTVCAPNTDKMKNFVPRKKAKSSGAALG